MFSETPIDHSCDAWQADSSIIPHDVEPRPYDEFYIKVYANFSRLPPQAAEDDCLMIDTLDCTTAVTQFWVPSPRLIRDNSNMACSLISDMLSRVGVPLDLHPFMISRISITAQSMAADAHNVGRRVLPMLVSIDIIQYDDQESADTEAAMLRIPMVEAQAGLC